VVDNLNEPCFPAACCLLIHQVSACVSSPVPEALLRAQAEKEYQAKLLELAQKGLARPEDIEAQLTEDALEAFISAE